MRAWGTLAAVVIGMAQLLSVGCSDSPVPITVTGVEIVTCNDQNTSIDVEDVSTETVTEYWFPHHDEPYCETFKKHKVWTLYLMKLPKDDDSSTQGYGFVKMESTL